MNVETKKESNMQHKTLHEAMLATRSELKNPLKKAENPHLKKKYAELPTIRDEYTPILTKNGLYVVSYCDTIDGREYLMVCIVHAATGDREKCPVPMVLERTTMQGLGAAITYARRYGICALLDIIGDDDDDGESLENRKPEPNQRRAAPQQQRQETKPPQANTAPPEYFKKGMMLYKKMKAAVDENDPDKFQELWAANNEQVLEKIRLDPNCIVDNPETGKQEHLYDMFSSLITTLQQKYTGE